MINFFHGINKFIFSSEVLAPQGELSGSAKELFSLLDTLKKPYFVFVSNEQSYESMQDIIAKEKILFSLDGQQGFDTAIVTSNEKLVEKAKDLGLSSVFVGKNNSATICVDELSEIFWKLVMR